MAKHGPGLGAYFAVFGTLMVLTGVTVAAAYADLGRFAAPVAVAIACIKATLVVLYFMHVRYESRLIALWAASGFVFLLIMLSLTFGEVMGRPRSSRDPLSPLGEQAAEVPTAKARAH
jgi:cytochrome c oxidase subunit IV